jgi:aspartate/tyrosine/aromatic aminotransferase
MPSFLATMTDANDIIVLHAFARNPTGTDLTESHWIEVAEEKNVPHLREWLPRIRDGGHLGRRAIRYFTEWMLSD